MLLGEYPVVSVHIPPALRPLAEGCEETMASGETVAEVLQAVGNTYPALAAALFCVDGSLAEGLAIHLGGTPLPAGTGLDHPILQEEVISIVAVAQPHCPSGFRPPPLAADEPDEAVISVGT
jgi:hypothetical protein